MSALEKGQQSKPSKGRDPHGHSCSKYHPGKSAFANSWNSQAAHNIEMGVEDCSQEEFSEPIGATPYWGWPDAIKDTNTPVQPCHCAFTHRHYDSDLA